MNRKVEFFKVDYEFMPLYNLSKTEDERHNTFVSIIIDSIENRDSNTIKVKEGSASSVIIEILSVTDDHLFGIIGKLEDLKGGILKRFRDKEDISVIEPDNEEINYYIENYTYFYVRFIDLTCAVLTNSSAPKFKTHFNNFLSSIIQCQHIKRINVVNVFDNKIDHKINRTRDISNIKMVFDGSSVIGNDLLYLDRAFCLSQSSLIEANINLNLRVKEVTEETKELLRRSETLESDFKKLEIVGTDYDNEEIQMELIERLLTKRVSIPIDDKYLRSSKDLDRIKEALIDALLII